MAAAGLSHLCSGQHNMAVQCFHEAAAMFHMDPGAYSLCTHTPSPSSTLGWLADSLQRHNDHHPTSEMKPRDAT